MQHGGPPNDRSSARVYGRRIGRPLRPGQQELMASVLPKLAITLPEHGALALPALFPRPITGLWLEIGFGAGEHLAAQAAAHPEIGFLGAEVFANGVARLLAEVSRRSLDNVRLFVDDARLLLAALPERSVARVFILFPDPWPKERHKKRRIVSTETLDRLAQIMSDAGELRLATDDADYAEWMAERVAARPDFALLAEGLTPWAERPADWPATRYEAKAVAAGRPARFFRLSRQPRAV